MSPSRLALPGISADSTGAFAFGIVYDKVTSAWWDAHNAGKQWKDIRHKYVEQEE
ncbi:hypothetical protein RTBOTA2_001686 [Rhodotorula toruloides]|uniref:Complex III subunit 9 n=1 Tax=Rhodotorula toruloides TaxID=5286 RepID=A0A2T0A6L2_RHOTO|nr:hypothetical protein RTBOTA2_001686 [Rhodotorula toruloides]PRQ73664.1 hypothetical protein AAT19DRAFT_15231 [Rhodotorula toruloides]